MESGFDTDPTFVIISMPSDQEQENEWPETGAQEAEKKDLQGDSAEAVEQ